MFVLPHQNTLKMQKKCLLIILCLCQLVINCKRSNVIGSVVFEHYIIFKWVVAVLILQHVL